MCIRGCHTIARAGGPVAPDPSIDDYQCLVENVRILEWEVTIRVKVLVDVQVHNVAREHEVRALELVKEALHSFAEVTATA